MLKVFISSTSKDLEAHRAVVRDRVLFAKQFPVMMEYWPASDKKVLDVIRESLQGCDLFIGVIALRYGEVDEETGKSFTELEYEMAGLSDIPRLMFLSRDEALFAANNIDPDRKKIDAFRARVLHDKTRVSGFFLDVAELKQNSSDALNAWQQGREASSRGIERALDSAFKTTDLRLQILSKLQQPAWKFDVESLNFFGNIVSWASENRRISDVVREAYLLNPGNTQLNDLWLTFDPEESHAEPSVDVFLSFDSNDAEWATAISTQLEAMVVKKAQSPVRFAMSMPDATPSASIAAAGKSKILVPILSKDYLDSRRCEKELAEYMSNHPQPEIIVAQRGKTKRSLRFDALSNSRARRFDHAEESKVPILIERLATDIVASLKNSSASAVEQTKIVFLADVSFDLVPQREEVRRRLIAKGIRVLPEDLLPADPGEFDKAVLHALDKCLLFIQLLSNETDDEFLGYPKNWLETLSKLAVESAPLSLCWFLRDAAPDAIAPAASPGGVPLTEGPLDEFLERILAALEPVVPPKLAVKYLAYALADASSVRQVARDHFKGHKVIYKSPDRFVPEEFRKELAESEKDIDEIYLLYLQAGPDAVDKVLWDCVKLCSADKPIYVVADPSVPPKATLPRETPNMIYRSFQDLGK
jgi:hypothetical protein